MTAVRVDTLRNRIAGTIDLLGKAREEADDLHLLAYDRRTAADEAKVAGGSRDYALDTHGDLKAREAYKHLADAILSACGTLEDATTYVNKVLRAASDTDPVKLGPRSTTAVELGEKIAAQARRIADDSYVPVRRMPQPSTSTAWTKLVKSKEAETDKVRALEDEVRQLRAELAEQRRTRRAS